MIPSLGMLFRRTHGYTFCPPFLFAGFVLVSLHQGCIVLPVPTGEDKVLAGEKIANEELSFIQVGATSSAEVVERLGEPTVIWEEERIFAYNWQTRWGILLWAIGGAGYSAAGGAEDMAKNYVLLIRFDSNDRVERFEATKRPPFESFGEHLEKWLRKENTKPDTGPAQPVEGATGG